MITDLGSLTLAAIVPAAATAQVDLGLAAGLSVADLQLQIAQLINFSPTLNLSFLAQIDIATSIIASLNAAISAELTPPTLQAQIDASISLKADLNLKLAALLAAAEFAVTLGGLLANGSVRLLKFSGNQDDFGAELAAELGAPTTSCNALVLLTTNGATWTAMQTVFKTS